VRSAGEFSQRLGLTGVDLTKLDDMRAAARRFLLSARSYRRACEVCGPRESTMLLRRSNPERIVSRVLALATSVSLIERAESPFDKRPADEPRRKLRKEAFTLEISAIS